MKTKNSTVKIIIICFLISFIPVVKSYQDVNLNKCDFSKNTSFLESSIIIPDNYPTIQQGIDNANSGDTIFVKEGIYKEHLIINKTGLTLQGENKYNTIIDGCKTTGDGIKIKAEDVTVKDLTIKNYKDKKKPGIYSWNQAGIEIHESNAKIINNYFVDNGVGLELFSSIINTTISDNEMINDSLLIGNYFDRFPSTFPEITKSSFVHNIYNNTVNGKPLYYFKDKSNFSAPTDAGQITMVNCSNFSIKDLYMNNNDFSLILAYCYDGLIENVTITDTNGETLLFECENITIQNNEITNTFKGICLEYKSKNNLIQNNFFSGNYVGISLFNSANNNTIFQNKVYDGYGYMGSGIEIVSYHNGTQKDNNITENQIENNPIGIHFRQNTINNTIYKNNITKNQIGIFLEVSSNNNKIINNNFQKNLIQASFYGCYTNIWNQNYWGKSKALPKPIFGLRNFLNLKFPYVNFDKNPKTEPII